MVRFSVSLDKEQNEWVEQRADELNGSKAQVIGMVVDAARQSQLQLGAAVDTSTGGAGEAVESRLQALESQLEQLESTIQDAPRDSSAPADSGGEDGDSRGPPQTQAAATDGVTSSDGSDTATSSDGSDTATSSDGSDTATASDDSDTATASDDPGTETTSDAPDADGTQSAVASEDPAHDAVQTFIRREATENASADQIAACWEFLKQRGTAGPRAFKDQFAPESCSTEDEVDVWWEDGVKPVLRQLPGVEPPEGGGRFFRYKY